MVRLLAAVLITCGLAAQLSAQATKDQASSAQSSKDQSSKDQTSNDQATKDAGSAGQAAASPSAKPQFPLEKFQEFSAVMVGSMFPGDERESYIYRSGKLMRTPGAERRNFIITNLNSQDSYGVAATGCIHDRHAHMLTVPFSFVGFDITVQSVAAGQETVDGHSCKIEDVTLSSEKFLKPVKLRLWEADDLQGFPVKVQFLRGFGHDPVIHYKNVVLGPQDPTLFIYPNSCEKSPGYNKPKPKATPGANKPAAKPPASAPQN
ncbi:MAG: hypothetical protein WCB11_24790 [Terriglobales bacterium]|jgi:hypothetical protein